MLKTIIGKMKKKKMNANVAQLERSNNKYYPLAFRNTSHIPVCYA